MSVLCGCVGKKGEKSPVHNTYEKKMSSKLRQPSSTGGGGRFGFGAKTRKHSTPVNKSPAPELATVAHSTSSLHSSYNEPALATGLTLNPSALLMGRNNDNDSLGGYISRDPQIHTKPRPLSSMASLGQSQTSLEQDSGFNSFSEPKSLVKPKSVLRSLFSRSSAKDRPASSVKDRPSSTKTSNLAGSNNNLNKINGNASGLARPTSRGSVGSTGSSASNHSTDSKSKLGYKRSSPIPSRAQSSSPVDQKTKTTGGQKSLQSKLVAATANAKSSSSLAKSSKYSSQSKSKSSRLSYPMTKQSTCAVIDDQCIATRNEDDVKDLHNNNISTSHCKQGTSIDPDRYNTIEDASAPVAIVDTDSETSFNVTDLSPRCTSNSLISTRSSRSMSSGMSSRDVACLSETLE